MAALAVGGAVLGTIAGIQGSLTQAVAAKFEGRVAAANAIADAEAFEFNAKVSDQQARNIGEVARAEAGDFRRAGSAALAKRRAAVAGSGVSGGSGSPLLVDEKILGEIEYGAGRIINKGDIAVVRQKNEGTLLRGQAKNARQNAVYARQAGKLGASAASLGVYSSIASGAMSVGNTLATAGKFG